MHTLNLITNTRGETFALSSYGFEGVHYGWDMEQRKMFQARFPKARVFSIYVSEQDCIDTIAALGGPGYHPGNEAYAA